MLLYGGCDEESFFSQTGEVNIARCITPQQCHQTQSVGWVSNGVWWPWQTSHSCSACVFLVLLPPRSDWKRKTCLLCLNASLCKYIYLSMLFTCHRELFKCLYLKQPVFHTVIACLSFWHTFHISAYLSHAWFSSEPGQTLKNIDSAFQSFNSKGQ